MKPSYSCATFPYAQSVPWNNMHRAPETTEWISLHLLIWIIYCYLFHTHVRYLAIFFKCFMEHMTFIISMWSTQLANRSLIHLVHMDQELLTLSSIICNGQHNYITLKLLTFTTSFQQHFLTNIIHIYKSSLKWMQPLTPSQFGSCTQLYKVLTIATLTWDIC